MFDDDSSSSSESDSDEDWSNQTEIADDLSFQEEKLSKSEKALKYPINTMMRMQRPLKRLRAM